MVQVTHFFVPVVVQQDYFLCQPCMKENRNKCSLNVHGHFEDKQKKMPQLQNSRN
jgi:hypothetical protein